MHFVHLRRLTGFKVTTIVSFIFFLVLGNLGSYCKSFVHTHMCSLQNQIHTHTRAHTHLQVRTGMSVFGFQRWKFSFSPLPEKKAAALLCSASNYWEMSVIHNLLCLKKICFWYSNPSAPSVPAWSCVESVVACF